MNHTKRLLNTYASREVAAQMIGDALSDPEEYPEDILKLQKAISEIPGQWPWQTEDVDVYVFHSHVLDVDREFARLFAEMWDVCPTHSCDPEICASDPETKCEGI